MGGRPPWLSEARGAEVNDDMDPASVQANRRRLTRIPVVRNPAWRRGFRYVRGMPDRAHALDPVDFSMHVLSLASTALIALGKMPAPDGEPHPIDLETAKHLIDVIAMLEIKTKGNLDEAEGKLIASLVYDLRVAFVDGQKSKHP
jgi:hypothetical protein